MRTERRIVVTGIGTINPLGRNVEEFWRHCQAGHSGVTRLTGFEVPPGYSAIVGAVAPYTSQEAAAHEAWLPDFGGMDRCAQLGLLAAREATAGARLGDVGDRARIGVYISTAIAQIGSMERAFLAQSQHARSPIERCAGAAGERSGARSRWRTFQFNTPASEIARAFDAAGGCVTVSTGCTGGLDAIGYAIDALRSGAVELAITGATEAPITPLVVAAFGKIGATSLRNGEPTRASRPFDKDRDGFVLAEGAGMLVLETLESARARDVPILAEVCGYGSINNCYHMTDIPEDGSRIARAAELAMRDAETDPSAIDAINAHGSSTPQNDVAETNAYRALFGDRARHIPVTSLKSQIGHPLAASNAIEVVASVLCLRAQIMSPTINLEQLDPRCPLDVVSETRRVAMRTLLKTSSGFSGIHSALVLRA